MRKKRRTIFKRDPFGEEEMEALRKRVKIIFMRDVTLGFTEESAAMKVNAQTFRFFLRESHKTTPKIFMRILKWVEQKEKEYNELN